MLYNLQINNIALHIRNKITTHRLQGFIIYNYINAKLTLTELQNTVLICQIVIYHNMWSSDNILNNLSTKRFGLVLELS